MKPALIRRSVPQSVIRGLFSKAALSLAVAAVGLIACEGSQQSADRAAQEKMAQADKFSQEHNLDAAVSASDQAAQVGGISTFAAGSAAMLQGQTRLARGNDYLNQAGEIDLNISRLLGQLRLANAHLKSAQSQVQLDEGYNPAQVQEGLKAKIIQTQTDLDALKQKAADLQGLIAKNAADAQAAAAKVNSLREQADQLQQKSLGETGQPSVDDVTSAADLRRQSTESSIAGDKLASDRINFTADLRTMNAQIAGMQTSLTESQKQIGDLDLAWTSVQQDVQAQNAVIAGIAGQGASAPAASGDQTENIAVPTPPKLQTTIADLCTSIQSQVGRSHDLRKKASDELVDATRYFDSAATIGDTVRRDLTDAIQADRTPPGEKLALQQLEETFNSSSARLSAADAERAVAMNDAAEAILGIQLRAALAVTQAALGSLTPPSVGTCLTAANTPSVDELSGSAEEQFKLALDHFDSQTSQTFNIPGGGSESRKTAAMAGKMVTAFGARQLSLALSNKPIAGQTPQDLQATINDLAKQITDADPSAMPAVPYTLAPPTTAPAAAQ